MCRIPQSFKTLRSKWIPDSKLISQRIKPTWVTKKYLACCVENPQELLFSLRKLWPREDIKKWRAEGIIHGHWGETAFPVKGFSCLCMNSFSNGELTASQAASFMVGHLGLVSGQAFFVKLGWLHLLTHRFTLNLWPDQVNTIYWYERQCQPHSLFLTHSG